MMELVNLAESKQMSREDKRIVVEMLAIRSLFSRRIARNIGRDQLGP